MIRALEGTGRPPTEELMSQQRSGKPLRIRLFSCLALSIVIANRSPVTQAKTASAKDKDAERSGMLGQDPQDMGAGEPLIGIEGAQDAPQAFSHTDDFARVVEPRIATLRQL
jgi:hypothetical protein